jgi:hypothetical protein
LLSSEFDQKEIVWKLWLKAWVLEENSWESLWSGRAKGSLQGDIMGVTWVRTDSLIVSMEAWVNEWVSLWPMQRYHGSNESREVQIGCVFWSSRDS